MNQKPAKSDADEGSFFSGFMAITFLILLGCVFFLALALTVWYRRSDRLVQTRVSNVQASGFIEPGLAEDENKPMGDTL